MACNCFCDCSPTEEKQGISCNCSSKKKGYVLVVYGSEKDEWFVDRITSKLEDIKREYKKERLSAHKNTKDLLELIDKVKDDCIVYITIAGKSNALSGVVAGNDKEHPVIACPPLKDDLEYIINIHSSLQMPSNVPVSTILNPENAAIFADIILRQVERVWEA